MDTTADHSGLDYPVFTHSGPTPALPVQPAKGNYAAKSVDQKTILHHITSPWDWTEKQQGYYFCDDQNCDVVHFGEDNSVITKSELRTAVGIKQ